MGLSHARCAMSVRFDDPNLVSCGGLAAVLALATRCGLATLLTAQLRITARGGANATAKILALVAGMIAGALASTFHTRARTGTIRAQLINTPGRAARSAHQLRLHLPQHWPWQDGVGARNSAHVMLLLILGMSPPSRSCLRTTLISVLVRLG